jgi:hypothetical protein
MPGKYYGVIRPSDNFIELTNTNDQLSFLQENYPTHLYLQVNSL